MAWLALIFGLLAAIVGGVLNAVLTTWGDRGRARMSAIVWRAYFVTS